MKLHPKVTSTEIAAQLRTQAEEDYGADRVEHIAGQIEHLSEMMAEIARRELDLTDVPPDRSGIRDRDER